MPALVTTSVQTSQDANTGQQRTIKVISYFITYNSSNYVFHGVASEPDFNAFIRTFETNMASFNRLTDPVKLNVTPSKIMVKAVPKTGTAADAFKSLGVAQNRMNEVALLNNIELSSQLSAGKMVKIIGK
jgi:predicted Zn-dependent protease